MSGEGEERDNYMDDGDVHLTRWILVGSGAVGAAGASLTIALFFALPRIRAVHAHAVLHLACADLVACLAFLLSARPLTFEFETAGDVCKAQAWLINFGGLAGVSWTVRVVKSLTAALCDSGGRPPAAARTGWAELASAYGWPFILSCGPLATKTYGPMGAFCWIGGGDHSGLGHFDDDATLAHWRDVDWNRLCCFYIPIWLGIGLSTKSLLRVRRWFVSTMLLSEGLMAAASTNAIGATNVNAATLASAKALLRKRYAGRRTPRTRTMLRRRRRDDDA